MEGSSFQLYRVYLDNFDCLEKVDPNLAKQIQGKSSVASLAVRQAYEDRGLPRHPKKSVSSAEVAEVQGALIFGDKGIAIPKPDKILVYTSLALELLRKGRAPQREMQVVCGGFVYFSMFRRPLLSGLNAVWRFIQDAQGWPPVVELPLSIQVRVELLRFCALVPLARMDFRLRVSEELTASDASRYGGGITVSRGLTPYGSKASQCWVRGDIAEEHDFHPIRLTDWELSG